MFKRKAGQGKTIIKAPGTRVIGVENQTGVVITIMTRAEYPKKTIEKTEIRETPLV